MAMRRDDPAEAQLAKWASDSAATWPVRGSGLFVWSDRLFLAAILLALVVQFLLIFRININWDEFHFLSFVYEHARGALIALLQTLHVHLFAWLPDSGATEIDEIIAGRLVMAALGCGSAALLYAIARRFLSRTGALFGLVAYLSLAAVVHHMASFRTDPLATFLCLLALFVLLRGLPRQYGAGSQTDTATGSSPAALDAMLAGIVMAVAMLVTVKSVFYLVAIGLALLCLARGPGMVRLRVLLRLAFSFSVPFLIVFAVLFWLHGMALAPRLADAAAPGAGWAGAFDIIANFLHRTGPKMFLEDGLFPRWREMLVSILSNPLFWIMTVWGALLAWRGARAGTMRDGWLALALAFPVIVPLFYRNAFAYNFVFILPPAAILAGFAFERMRARAAESGRTATRLLFATIALGPCVFLVAGIARDMPDATEPQRRLVEAVHQIFPDSVPYIDGYGVVARFPRVGFFNSSWGLDRYRATGQDFFPDRVAETQPPLLLADSPALHAALLEEIEVPDEIALLPEDAAFLAAHYLQYWGMIFVVGQRLSVAEPGETVGFDIVVAGDYRLEAEGPVRFDGVRLQPGESVRFETGPHEFTAGPGMTETVLRWADLGEAPDAEPVGLLEFFGVEP